MDNLAPTASNNDSALQPNVPEDFDEFWKETIEEAHSAGAEFHRGRTSIFDFGEFDIYGLDFRGIRGNKLFGWISIPREREKKLLGFVWYPPYGRESSIPNMYSTRKGMVSFSFNFHGLPALHQETYQPSRGYFTQEILVPHTWVFREMAQNAYIALRVLRAQLEVDEDKISAMGLSQGGGIAIWMGAHCPFIKTVVADLPFLCGLRETLNQPVYRYPLKEIMDFVSNIPLGLERVLYTISYFDTINQATRVKVPALVSLGKKDPACKPPNVRACFDAIPSEKKLIEYEGGHDYDPLMVENNRRWLWENLVERT